MKRRFWNVSRLYFAPSLVTLVASASLRERIYLDDSKVIITPPHNQKYAFLSRIFRSKTQENSILSAGDSYNANNPSEDRWLIHQFPSRNIQVGFVADGHGGWQVSEYVYRNIVDLITQYLLPEYDPYFIEEKMIEMFDKLENDHIEAVRQAYLLGYGEVAKVGSCVLLAYSTKNDLIIANCGDCRAVLGTSTDEKKYYATRITLDHNCREPIEEFQLKYSHPNESDVIRCKSSRACYVKGRLQLTRAIGDLYLKQVDFNAPVSQHAR